MILNSRSLFMFEQSLIKTILSMFSFVVKFQRLKMIILLNNFKKNSENVSTQKNEVERLLCAQTQDLQICKKFYVSQMSPQHCILSSTNLHR